MADFQWPDKSPWIDQWIEVEPGSLVWKEASASAGTHGGRPVTYQDLVARNNRLGHVPPELLPEPEPPVDAFGTPMKTLPPYENNLIFTADGSLESWTCDGGMFDRKISVLVDSDVFAYIHMGYVFNDQAGRVSWVIEVRTEVVVVTSDEARFTEHQLTEQLESRAQLVWSAIQAQKIYKGLWEDTSLPNHSYTSNVYNNRLTCVRCCAQITPEWFAEMGHTGGMCPGYRPPGNRTHWRHGQDCECRTFQVRQMCPHTVHCCTCMLCTGQLKHEEN